MTNIEQHTSFSDLQKSIESYCSDAPKLNVIGSCRIKSVSLGNSIFGDTYTNAAKAFMSDTESNKYYLNHAKYYRGDAGLAYVAEELQRKNDSNRALLALCNQDVFLESADEPTPSFLLAQFGIQEKTLHYTAYYRALEASDFLKTNLEEARIACQKITQQIANLEDCVITIFAFRCYCRQEAHSANGLLRPIFDRLSQVDLFLLLQEEPTELIQHLREKSGTSTVIEYHNFELWREHINTPKHKNTMHAKTSNIRVLQLLTDCCNLSSELRIMRMSQSHSNLVAAKTKLLSEAIEKLADNLEQ